MSFKKPLQLGPNLEFKRGLLYQRKRAGFRKKGHLIFVQIRTKQSGALLHTFYLK